MESNIYQELKVEDDASILERIGRFDFVFLVCFLFRLVVCDIWNSNRAYVMTDALSRQDQLTTSGSTAVSALIHNTGESRHLYIANVGDSRAVLCSSHDHDMSVSHDLPLSLFHSLFYFDQLIVF